MIYVLNFYLVKGTLFIPVVKMNATMSSSNYLIPRLCLQLMKLHILL